MCTNVQIYIKTLSKHIYIFIHIYKNKDIRAYLHLYILTSIQIFTYNILYTFTYVHTFRFSLDSIYTCTYIDKNMDFFTYLNTYIAWESKTKQRVVFGMTHVKDSLLPCGKIWSLDFPGMHAYTNKFSQIRHIDIATFISREREREKYILIFISFIQFSQLKPIN